MLEGSAKLQRKLNSFDVTNLVIGSIIGADIYVATGIAAALVGPSSLLLWILAGVLAIVIAISFSHCVMLLPKVGGPYAYVREVSSPFPGFMVGWALLAAEWFSLAVFPVAFAQYFTSLVPGIGPTGVVLLKGAFIVFVIVTNIVGAKAAGRTNDVLTILKISPLVLMIIAGLAFILFHPTTVADNMTPFVTGDLSSFGTALVLVFWAYAGFELSTLPASDVERPERTIPRAITLGMLFVIAFYLMTNLVVLGAVDQQTLLSTSTPLLSAASAIFGSTTLISSLMVLVVGIGALFSILGADESGTIGSTRLAYAMAVDGLLPKAFAKLHPKYGTPYIALIVLCSTAFVASVFGGLRALISSSVFLLSFVYLATCISAIKLGDRNPEIAMGLRGRRIIPLLGAAFSLLLIVLVDPIEIAISLVVLGVGALVFLYFSPQKELSEARAVFLSDEAILWRAARQRLTFLAHPVFHLKRFVHRRRGIGPAIVVTNGDEHP
jgi:basic amino acid/polyamine antiporter, APA family